MNEFLKKILAYYSLSEEDYLNLSKPIEEISLIDPNKIEGMCKVINHVSNFYKVRI